MWPLLLNRRNQLARLTSLTWSPIQSLTSFKCPLRSSFNVFSYRFISKPVPISKGNFRTKFIRFINLLIIKIYIYNLWLNHRYLISLSFYLGNSFCLSSIFNLQKTKNQKTSFLQIPNCENVLLSSFLVKFKVNELLWLLALSNKQDKIVPNLFQENKSIEINNNLIMQAKPSVANYFRCFQD